ncbi:hypothetical protein ACFL1A_03420 [Patescibacteria group bacterium]
MNITGSIAADTQKYSAKIQNLDLEKENVFAGVFQKTASFVFKLAAYLTMFSLATAGYMLLPDLVAKYQMGCNFKTITAKSEYKTDQYSRTFYSYDDGSQAWDSSDYPIGDLVCVKE